MKKGALIAFMAIAVLGLMPARAWSQVPINIWVSIQNSAETPVMLSLACDDDHTSFDVGNWHGTKSCVIQPGQSGRISSQIGVWDASEQWNILYNFYDGTSEINQRISIFAHNYEANCANFTQSGVYAVSEGTFVDETQSDCNSLAA